MQENKHHITISNKLYQSIKRYCDENKLKINEFVEDLLKKSFMVEKYGEAPSVIAKREKEPTEATVKNDYLETIEPVKQNVIEEPTVEPVKTERKSKITRLS